MEQVHSGICELGQIPSEWGHQYLIDYESAFVITYVGNNP